MSPSLIMSYACHTGRIDDGRMASYRQPKLVTGGLLRDYQLDGLDWLRVSISIWFYTLIDQSVSISLLYCISTMHSLAWPDHVFISLQSGLDNRRVLYFL